MYLVKFSSDWADEFDCNGFAVVGEKGLELIKNGIETATYPREEYFGTNEFFEFYSKEEVLRKLVVSEISELEADTIKTLLGKYYGIFPNFSDWPSFDD